MKVLAALLLLPALTAVAAGNSAFDGDWRAQAQYQASVGGKLDQSAHAVTPLSITIDPMGKVTGSSPGNGCRLLGIVRPGSSATILDADVTLSGCQYHGFNRRFTGSLIYSQQAKHILFQLHAPTGRETYDVRGTLRR